MASLAARFDHDLLVSDRDDLPGHRLVPHRGTGSTGHGSAAHLPSHRPHLVLTTGTTGAPARRPARLDPAACAGCRASSRRRRALAAGLRPAPVRRAADPAARPRRRRPRWWRPPRAVPARASPRCARSGVTHASATPTYWRFLLAEMRSDGGPVPALRQVTLGGEAIPGPLLGSCATTFPDGRGLAGLRRVASSARAGRCATGGPGCRPTSSTAATTPTST